MSNFSQSKAFSQAAYEVGHWRCADNHTDDHQNDPLWDDIIQVSEMHFVSVINTQGKCISRRGIAVLRNI